MSSESFYAKLNMLFSEIDMVESERKIDLMRQGIPGDSKLLQTIIEKGYQ